MTGWASALLLAVEGLWMREIDLDQDRSFIHQIRAYARWGLVRKCVS